MRFKKAGTLSIFSICGTLALSWLLLTGRYGEESGGGGGVPGRRRRCPGVRRRRLHASRRRRRLRVIGDERYGDVEGVASFQKHPWLISESSALRFYADFSDLG